MRGAASGLGFSLTHGLDIAAPYPAGRHTAWQHPGGVCPCLGAFPSLYFEMTESTQKTAQDLLRLGNSDGARRIVDTELKKCGDKGSSTDVWSLRFTRADLIRYAGHTDEALKYLHTCEKEFPPENHDLPSQIGLKKTSGYCLCMLGKYAPSEVLLQEAEYIARDTGLLELLCEVQYCQAWLRYVRNDLQSSEQLFREIFRTSEQIDNWYFRAVGLWGIGKNIMMRGHRSSDPVLLKEALPWFEKSHDLFAAAGRQMFAFGDMAVCFLGMGDDTKSLELLEDVLSFYAEAGWVHNYQATIANIGNVYRYRGDYLRAIEYYRCAVEYAQEIKDPVSIRKWSYNIRLSYSLIRQSVERMRGAAA